MSDRRTPNPDGGIPEPRLHELASQFREFTGAARRRLRLDQVLQAIEDRMAVDSEKELRQRVQPDRRSDRRMLKALNRVLVSMRDWTRRDVMGRIKAIMAKLGQRHSAGTSWLSIAGPDGKYSALVIQAEREQRLGREIGPWESGIVPRVLRTGTAYAIGDVRDDPYYSKFFASTRSEQAVPIAYKAGPGREEKLAVVNQESRAIAQYHAASAEVLCQEAEVLLAPLLSEFNALLSEDFPCAWDPHRHGWGLHDYLETVLQQIKEQLDPARLGKDPFAPRMNNLHLTVWYVDLEDRRISKVADTGFSDGVRTSESIPIADEEVLGRLAQSDEDWRCESWLPDSGMKHIHQELLVVMGILRSRLILSPRLVGPGGDGQFRTIIQIDAFTEEADAILPDKDELPEIGRLIHSQIAGYLGALPHPGCLRDPPSVAREPVLRRAVA